MFVASHGRGPDRYLALHGWNGSSRTFDPLVPFVQESATLYMADLPGCGKSPAVEWTLPAIAAAIAREIERLAPVTVLGQCSGGLLGLCAAVRVAPSAITRLVLIDALAYWPWYFQVFAARGWGKYAYTATFANPAGKWLTNQALRGRRTGDTNLTDGFAPGSHEVTLAYLRVLTAMPQPSEFSALRMPLDLVFGSRTFRAVRRSARIWGAVWPHARVTELAGAGHLPVREATAALARLVFGETSPCLHLNDTCAAAPR